MASEAAPSVFGPQFVQNNVDSQLLALQGDSFKSAMPQLWSAIDREVSVNDCEVYRWAERTCSVRST